MDNQHKLIKGYRDLSEGEIKAMNAVKSEAERIGLLVEELEANTDLMHVGQLLQKITYNRVLWQQFVLLPNQLHSKDYLRWKRKN